MTQVGQLEVKILSLINYTCIAFQVRLLELPAVTVRDTGNAQTPRESEGLTKGTMLRTSRVAIRPLLAVGKTIHPTKK
jgi:hypothetical protein